MTGSTVTRGDIVDLLKAKLGEVLDRDPSAISDEARFDEDLQADSLDLVEVIEGVEGQLRARGASARLAEDELVSLRTVGDAVDRLLAACAEARA